MIQSFSLHQIGRARIVSIIYSLIYTEQEREQQCKNISHDKLETRRFEHVYWGTDIASLIDHNQSTIHTGTQFIGCELHRLLVGREVGEGTAQSLVLVPEFPHLFLCLSLRRRHSESPNYLVESLIYGHQSAQL